MASKRGGNLEVLHTHGERQNAEKWFAATEFPLTCFVKFTDANGDVTHIDGAAGHGRENLATLKRLFGARKLVRLTRKGTPHHGDNETFVESLAGLSAGEVSQVVVFILRMVKPFWRLLPINPGGGTPSIATLGNGPIDDMVITFTAGTNAKLTVPAIGELPEQTVQIDGTPTGPTTTVVDVGARTVTGTTANDRIGLLTLNKPWWLEFPPNETVLLSLTGGGTVSIDHYDKLL